MISHNYGLKTIKVTYITSSLSTTLLPGETFVETWYTSTLPKEYISWHVLCLSASCILVLPANRNFGRMPLLYSCIFDGTSSCYITKDFLHRLVVSGSTSDQSTFVKPKVKLIKDRHQNDL